jgi:PAS domain S-box-containing protein
MNNGLNTRITAAIIALLREKGVDPELLAECVGHQLAFLSRPDRYLPNEEFIVAVAEARHMTGRADLARAAGARVARDLFAEGSARKLSLDAGPGALEREIAQTLRQLIPALVPAVERPARGRIVVELGARGDYLHTHDHCELIRGILAEIMAAAGATAIEIRESSCRVTVDRVGEIGGLTYRLDDAGGVWERRPGKNGEGFEERAVRPAAADGSHEVQGTVYGSAGCRFELSFQDGRSRPARLWAASGGRLVNFFRLLRNLDRNWMLEQDNYDQIAHEWRRWLRWEPSYHLTKVKYLAYLAMLAFTCIPVFGRVFAQLEDGWLRTGLTLLLTALILLLGFALTKVFLDYSRRLHRQRADSEKFLQFSGVGVTMIAPDFTIAYANPLVLEVHGEVTGRKCYEALRWESGPCADCPLREILAGKEQARREKELLNKDGQRRWFDVTATPVLDARARLTSVMIVSTDITGRKLLEEELAANRLKIEASEEKYRNFMANAAEAIIITDPENRIVEVNRRTRELLGIDPEPLLGRDLFELDLLPGADRNRIRALFADMIAERLPCGFETRLSIPDGRTIDIESRAIPILDHGQVAWVQSILRDVTERKQQEWKTNLLLSLSNAIKDAPSLQAMIDQALAGICAVMQVPIGGVFLQSPENKGLRLAAQAGLSPQATMKMAAIALDGSAGDVASRGAILKRPIVIGGRDGIVVPPSTLLRLEQIGIASLAAAPLLMENEIQGAIYLASRDRDYFTPQRMASILQVANELAVGIARQKLRDLISEKNRELTAKNLELEQASAQLIQSEKMASIGQLAAGVAHEINNPMGYVNSNLNLLKTYREDLARMFQAYRDLELNLEQQNLDPATAAKLELVRRLDQKIKLDEILSDLKDMIAESIEGAERVTQIVKNLKDFSHPESGRRQQINLHDALESTLNIVWNEIKYKAELVKDYGDLPPIVCYPQELKQVFMNLLVNASQAIPERGEIRVQTRRQGDWVNVEIRDNGVGIPPENLPRIFDPFFTTKEVGHGTGLGLAISYSIVNKHGGRILVESEPGRGAAFTVQLPLAPPADTQEAETAETGESDAIDTAPNH